MGGGNLLETKEKLIDDMAISTTMFPGLYGLKIKGRLLKLVGPGLSKALGGLKYQPGGKRSIVDADIDLGMIGQGLVAITEKLDQPEVLELIKDMLQSTRLDGKEINEAVLNFKFAGKYTTLYKVLLFVVEVNRFFGKGSIGDLISASAIPANTPATESAKG